MPHKLARARAPPPLSLVTQHAAELRMLLETRALIVPIRGRRTPLRPCVHVSVSHVSSSTRDDTDHRALTRPRAASSFIPRVCRRRAAARATCHLTSRGDRRPTFADEAAKVARAIEPAARVRPTADSVHRRVSRVSPRAPRASPRREPLSRLRIKRSGVSRSSRCATILLLRSFPLPRPGYPGDAVISVANGRLLPLPSRPRGLRCPDERRLGHPRRRRRQNTATLRSDAPLDPGPHTVRRTCEPGTTAHGARTHMRADSFATRFDYARMHACMRTYGGGRESEREEEKIVRSTFNLMRNRSCRICMRLARLCKSAGTAESSYLRFHRLSTGRKETAGSFFLFSRLIGVVPFRPFPRLPINSS